MMINKQLLTNIQPSRQGLGETQDIKTAIARSLVIGLTMFTATAMCTSAFAQVASSSCGQLRNHYGPFDYRTTSEAGRKLVEDYHFTPQVEALIKGQSGYKIGPDLDYTLRVFPNHLKAILAMVRYGKKENSPQPSDVAHPVECYFERALRFQPDDNNVRMFYAIFLSDNGRNPAALAELNRASTAASGDAFTQYNVGLVYFDMKEYDKALAQAHKAMALGFPRSALKDQLVQAGKWVEPVTPAAPRPPASTTP